MAQAIGKGFFNLGSVKVQEQLTPEVVKAKAVEISERFKDLIIAFGLGVDLLAQEGDALGLLSLSTAVKMMLADGAARCADAIDAANITE